MKEVGVRQILRVLKETLEDASEINRSVKLCRVCGEEVHGLPLVIAQLTTRCPFCDGPWDSIETFAS